MTESMKRSKKPTQIQSKDIKQLKIKDKVIYVVFDKKDITAHARIDGIWISQAVSRNVFPSNENIKAQWKIVESVANSINVIEKMGVEFYDKMLDGMVIKEDIPEKPLFGKYEIFMIGVEDVSEFEELITKEDVR